MQVRENIRALAAKGDWAPEQYVVVYMNGCDTYAYVDDALYAAHRDVNPDETGTRYVDLVTNAMPAIFRYDRRIDGAHEGFRIPITPRHTTRSLRTSLSSSSFW